MIWGFRVCSAALSYCTGSSVLWKQPHPQARREAPSHCGRAKRRASLLHPIGMEEEDGRRASYGRTDGAPLRTTHPHPSASPKGLHPIGMEGAILTEEEPPPSVMAARLTPTPAVRTAGKYNLPPNLIFFIISDYYGSNITKPQPK